MDPIYVVAFVWIISAILAATIAGRRGTSPVNGFILGLILGPLGVIMAAVQKPAVPVTWDK